jgi:predicted PurR-regulated permease PerM
MAYSSAGEGRRADIVFTIALLAVLFVAWQIIDVLLLIYVAMLFAVVLSPAVDTVRRIDVFGHRPGRGLAILLLLVGVLAAIALFLIFFVPPVLNDLQAFAQNWPNKMHDFSARVRQYPFMENFDAGKLANYWAEIAGGALGFARGLAGGIFAFFSWFILTAYFIVDGDRTFHWAMSMVPRKQRERLEPTLQRAEKRVSMWLMGQGALMLILFTYTIILFGVLRLPYFYALALFCGLANIVPIIGPVVSVGLAALVALGVSPIKMALVIAGYIVYQQVENAFLTPRIMKSTVDLPPLAVICALAIGGALAGVLGALVAVPTAALLNVIIDEYLVRKDATVATP